MKTPTVRWTHKGSLWFPITRKYTEVWGFITKTKRRYCVLKYVPTDRFEMGIQLRRQVTMWRDTLPQAKKTLIEHIFRNAASPAKQGNDSLGA